MRIYNLAFIYYSSFMKIVFFGSSSYVLPVIEKLKKDFEIELVITTEKDEKGEDIFEEIKI